MKRFLLLLVAALAIAAADANEVQDLNLDEAKFADHELTFYQIEREWHDHHFFSVGDKVNIKMLLLSFAQAYPHALSNSIVAVMLGVEQEDRLGNFVLDERNGYVSGELLTELTCSLQMCYWRRNDGDILIAVALQGYEYKWEGNREAWENLPVDEDDGEPSFCVNDLMFFKLEKGEVMWLPKTPKQIIGRDIDFKRYNIQLPRHGKDIVLTEKSEDDHPATVTLRWNGIDFTRR